MSTTIVSYPAGWQHRIRIDGGAWDRGAADRLIPIGRAFMDAGLWDGLTDLDIHDVYRVHGLMFGPVPFAPADLRPGEHYTMKGQDTMTDEIVDGEIITIEPVEPGAIQIVDDEQQQRREWFGAAADEAARRFRFDEYQQEKADNTNRRQKNDLKTFAEYLGKVAGIMSSGADLYAAPDAWRGITWGIVKGFREWMLQQSYAIGTVNIKLSTVKTYAKMAFEAGVIPENQHLMIDGVNGLKMSAGKNRDERRAAEGIDTRRGNKKARSIELTADQRRTLKRDHEDTPQGRRDAVLMCLMLDHGLRASEVEKVLVGGVDFSGGENGRGEITFYRPKVNEWHTHDMSSDTRRALKAYFNAGDAPLPNDAPLLRKSRSLKDGGAIKTEALGESGMSTRAITKRVNLIGRRHGIEGLSAHDLRHSGATAFCKRYPNQPLKLQEWGGWKSLAMPRRYVDYAEVANRGYADLD